MTGPNLYAVLGVEQGASDEELRAAFRKRSRLTHPDQGGDAVAFRAVEGAYRILSDPGLRAGYDAELDGTPRDPGPSRSETDTATQTSQQNPPRGSGPDPSGASWRRTDGPFTQPRPVDFGQIRWSLDFVGPDGTVLHDAGEARIVPGRAWWVWKPASWLLIAAWLLLGSWVGGVRVSSGFGLALVAWGAAWAVAGLVVTVHAAQGRWSYLIPASAALAWPAYTSPGELWSWGVYLWLAGAVLIPVLRARVGTPMWSRRVAASGNVFGEASWYARGTAAVVEQLTVIPGVRVVHQVAGAEHAIVLDRRVALVGDVVVASVGTYPTRAWPSVIDGDPQEAVSQIGAWLLSDSDPFVVDRRTLAAVARAPRGWPGARSR